MTRRLAVLAPLAAVVAVAGCGGSSTKTQSTGAAQTSTPAQTSTTVAPVRRVGVLTVGETQYMLTPANPTVSQSGAVTVTARNDGSIVHALEVEGGGAGGKDVRTADIQPGSSATLHLNLKSGTYQIYCPIDGHKGLGMKGTIVVTGAAAAAAQPSTTTSTQSSGGSTSGGGGY